ncbi:hypothetical protein STENM223S_08595 [Streptomyces tendae]
MALGHDVRTGGLAEGRVGAGRGADRFLFVPLGTGIAGAIGIAGRVESGAHGFAGEIGHVVVRPGGSARARAGSAAAWSGTRSASAVSRAWAEASGDPDADAADCAAAVVSGDARALAGVAGRGGPSLADGLVAATHSAGPARTCTLAEWPPCQEAYGEPVDPPPRWRLCGGAVAGRPGAARTLGPVRAGRSARLPGCRCCSTRGPLRRCAATWPGRPPTTADDRHARSSGPRTARRRWCPLGAAAVAGRRAGCSR